VKLAIWFDELIRACEITDYAEPASLGSVYRGRVTQIMNLLSLAPVIRKALLYFDVAPAGTILLGYVSDSK
jgi:hypothetical protein